MYSWLKTHHKSISGVLNAAVGIAALVFVIMQNEDSTSSTGFTGMRLTGLIGVAMPQIGRLFEAKRVEDKAKKIADCFLFGMLGATFTSTAYSWGSALTTVELTSLGLTAIGNGFVEKAILDSKIVSLLMQELNRIKLRAKNKPDSEAAVIMAIDEAQAEIRRVLSPTETSDSSIARFFAPSTVVVSSTVTPLSSAPALSQGVAVVAHASRHVRKKRKARQADATRVHAHSLGPFERLHIMPCKFRLLPGSESSFES